MIPARAMLEPAPEASRVTAREWLERAYGRRDCNVANLAVALEFDAYRSDPRFAALLERVGLPRDQCRSR